MRVESTRPLKGSGGNDETQRNHSYIRIAYVHIAQERLPFFHSSAKLPIYLVHV